MIDKWSSNIQALSPSKIKLALSCCGSSGGVAYGGLSPGTATDLLHRSIAPPFQMHNMLMMQEGQFDFIEQCSCSSMHIARARPDISAADEAEITDRRVTTANAFDLNLSPFIEGWTIFLEVDLTPLSLKAHHSLGVELSIPSSKRLTCVCIG